MRLISLLVPLFLLSSHLSSFPVHSAPAASSSSSPSSSSSSSSTSGSTAPRHSFRSPFDRTINFWSAGAGAFINETYVRLTPQKQSRTGYIWNTVPVTMSDWSIEMEFQVKGLRSLGGDGFALWYVERPEVLGVVYGSADYWTGLGLFFDTFNNDGVGSSPLITAVYNDGTQRYDTTSDGASQAFASCSFDFRNQPVTSFARVTYQNYKLSLDIALGRSTADQTPIYKNCFTVDEVELGVDKFFGITAHTGEVADSHDIYNFIVKDLSPEAVDLNSIRSHYQHTLEEQHSTPEHLAMNADDFQHTVLTTLKQMQGSLNLIELSQLSMSDFLYSQKPLSASIGPAGGSGAGSESSVSGDDGGHHLQLDQESFNKLVDVQDKAATISKEVAALKLTLNSVQSVVTASSNSNSKAGTTTVTDNALQSHQSTLTSVSTSVASLAKKLDDALVRMGQLSSDISLIRSTQTQLAQTPPPSSGLGWFSYSCVLFTAVCVGALTFHTFNQHMKKERYKMI